MNSGASHLQQEDRAGRLFIAPRCRIAISSLSFRTSRSGGPGGQHVNKVETKVELLFDVAGSTELTADQRDRIRERLASRIDDRGILHIVSAATRSQWKNREKAVEKFVHLLRDALKPRPTRKRTRPSSSAREKRLQSKRHRSETKQMRKRPSP